MATTDTDMREIQEGRIMLTMKRTKDTTIRIKVNLSKILLLASNQFLMI